jgi:RNA recognition motif-containing protein
MRPAHKTISAGRLDGSRAGCVQNQKPLFFERASEPGSSTATVSPKPILIRSFFSIPNRGKVIYMSTKLYVGNLAFQTTSEELQELFAQAGTVESASVVEDRMTGRSRGFAFVEMATKEEAAAAIDQFNGKEVGGRALKVNEAKPRENRGGGGGRGFGGGGGRGGYGGGGNRNGGGRGGNYGGGGGGNREPRW